MLGVDGAHGGLESVRRGDQRMAEQHVEKRRGVRGAARLDDDALEARNLAARAAPVEVGECLVERAGVGAAQAAGIEQHHVVGRLGNHHVVEADFAELVHYHGRVGERRVFERLVEERRLAAAEEAGEEEDGSFLLQHGVAQPAIRRVFLDARIIIGPHRVNRGRNAHETLGRHRQ